MLFQSTPSSRRATPASGDGPPENSISIHALLTEGDPAGNPAPPPLKISIHALLTEGDDGLQLVFIQVFISIHALLTEGDSNFAQNISINFSIYMLHLYDFTFYGI